MNEKQNWCLTGSLLIVLLCFQGFEVFFVTFDAFCVFKSFKVSLYLNHKDLGVYIWYYYTPKYKFGLF